jgi:hypothetical protein
MSLTTFSQTHLLILLSLALYRQEKQLFSTTFFPQRRKMTMTKTRPMKIRFVIRWSIVLLIFQLELYLKVSFIYPLLSLTLNRRGGTDLRKVAGPNIKWQEMHAFLRLHYSFAGYDYKISYLFGISSLFQQSITLTQGV